MNRYKKLASDSVVMLIGTFGSKLLVFLLMPLYTAILSPSEYGTAELITGTANLVMPFACMGITSGIFRFTMDKNANKAEVFSTSVAVLLIGMAGLLAVSLPVALFGGQTRAVVLVVLYVLLADLQAVCAQYVRAIDRPVLFAGQGIFNTLFTILSNVLFLVVFDMGMTGYVLAVIVGNTATTLLLVWRAKLWRVFSLSQVKRRTAGELLRFSLPMIPTTVCWLITDLSDRYFVSAICGEAATGIYSAAYKIPTIVTLLSSIFMQAWQFSAVAESEDEEGCKRFYSEVFRGFLSLILAGTAVLILATPILCELLLSDAYGEARLYMPTLLVSAALGAIVSFLATVYLVQKKSLNSFYTSAAGMLLNLLGNAILIPRIGVIGAAIATATSYGAVYLIRLWDTQRLMRFALHLPRQIIGILLLGASAICMTLSFDGRIALAAILTAASIALHLPALLSDLKKLYLQRFGGEKMQKKQKKF